MISMRQEKQEKRPKGMPRWEWKQKLENDLNKTEMKEEEVPDPQGLERRQRIESIKDQVGGIIMAIILFLLFIWLIRGDGSFPASQVDYPCDAGNRGAFPCP